MPLTSQGGRLLASGGHLCNTCCSPCSGPNCIDFSVLFPRLDWDKLSLYEPSLPPCETTNRPGTITYRATQTNPLSVAADLVVTIDALFDDDLYVNGASLSGDPCSKNWTAPVGTMIVSGVAAGGSVDLAIRDNWGVQSGAYGCACWRPTAPSASYAGIALAKSRFDICKGCSESLQDGFVCRLVSGCCFGQKRSDPAFKCPAGKW